MKTQQVKYPRPSKAWLNSKLSMAHFNPLRAGGKQNGKQRPSFPSGYVAVRECFGSIMRLPRNSVSHLGPSVGARETSDGKRCLGRQGSTVAYSPSIPGYMTGCSLHIFAACHSWCGTKKNRTRNKDLTCLRSHIVRRSVPVRNRAFAKAKAFSQAVITHGRADSLECRRSEWCVGSRSLLSGCLSVLKDGGTDHDTLGFQRITLRGIDDLLFAISRPTDTTQ